LNETSLEWLPFAIAAARHIRMIAVTLWHPCGLMLALTEKRPLYKIANGSNKVRDLIEKSSNVDFYVRKNKVRPR
jgi:hypothetical protein